MEKTREHYFKLFNKHGSQGSINARYIVKPKPNSFWQINSRSHHINFNLKHGISIQLMFEREKEPDFICWGGSPEFFEYIKKLNNKNK